MRSASNPADAFPLLPANRVHCACTKISVNERSLLLIWFACLFVVCSRLFVVCFGWWWGTGGEVLSTMLLNITKQVLEIMSVGVSM